MTLIKDMSADRAELLKHAVHTETEMILSFIKKTRDPRSDENCGLKNSVSGICLY